jgi:hypothetical protein
MIDMARREASAPLVDRCDIRLKTDATTAPSKVERLKTSMVADRACQRLYGTPHPPWPSERDRNDWDSRPIQATMSLPKPKHWFRTPLLGAYVTQTPLSVDNLGSVARRTTPSAQNWHKKVTSGIGLPALRDPGKMLDMVTTSHVLRQLTSGPSILDQITNSKRWLGGLVISNIGNRR